MERSLLLSYWSEYCFNDPDWLQSIACCSPIGQKIVSMVLIGCRSAGEQAFHEIYRLLEEERQEHPLAPLQQGLLAASVLAIILLLVLIIVLARNRYITSISIWGKVQQLHL